MWNENDKAEARHFCLIEEKVSEILKAEKLNLNVSSIGGWHIAPKTFQFQWNCISYGELFQKNSFTSCCTHLFHLDAKKQAEKS